jgi:hypothetical protein
LDEALAAFQQEGIEALRLSGTAMAQHALGRRAECEATLKQAIERCAGEGALQIAEAFAYCGDADRAFEWLERAYLQRDSGLPQMQSWPLLRNLHGDPRWERLLEKMGLVSSGDTMGASIAALR